MPNIIHDYGSNAGRVWYTLHIRGALTEEELLRETHLPFEDFYAAVGWLARENKIKREGDRFQLDTTNLTTHIGENAGRIWNLLQIWNEVNVAHIPDYLDIDQSTTYAALGWLAREGKIHLTKKRKVKID